jgi:hypothetical protein
MLPDRELLPIQTENRLALWTEPKNKLKKVIENRKHEKITNERG